jgi:hypothetical protein
MDHTMIRGCSLLVQFAEKKVTLMPSELLYLVDGQDTCPRRVASFYLASNWQRKSTKILVVIHAFLLCVYLHGKVDIFLKHFSIANFPITTGFSFTKPSALEQSNTVRHSLLFFPPWLFLPSCLELMSRRVLSHEH